MQRFNLIFRKYILLWAFFSMIIGYLAGRYNHERVVSLKFFITPLLFLMIFIMIFPINIKSLLKFRLYISPMVASFIIFILSPFLATFIAIIIPERFDFLRTGIVIASTVPPDAMLSAWAGFLEGDVLLTLIIQSFTFILWIILVPFGFTVLFSNSSDFYFFPLLTNLFFLILLPFILAGLLKMLLRKYLNSEVLKRIRPTLSSASGIIELFIILISIALRTDIIQDNPIIIWWGIFTAFLYYSVSFFVGFYISKLFRFNYEVSIPLIYENGSKNLPIAMVIAITSFQNQAILGVAACIIAQFPTSAFFYSRIRRYLFNKDGESNSGTD